MRIDKLYILIAVVALWTMGGCGDSGTKGATVPVGGIEPVGGEGGEAPPIEEPGGIEPVGGGEGGVGGIEPVGGEGGEAPPVEEPGGIEPVGGEGGEAPPVEEPGGVEPIGGAGGTGGGEGGAGMAAVDTDGDGIVDEDDLFPHCSTPLMEGGQRDESGILRVRLEEGERIGVMDVEEFLRTDFEGKCAIDGSIELLDVEEAGQLQEVSGKLAQVSANIRDIRGNFRVADTGLQAVHLEKLRYVGGSVSASRNATLASMELPALTSVGEYVLVWQNYELGSIEFPALTSVGTYVYVQDNAALTSILFPQLRSIGSEEDDDVDNRGGLVIQYMPELTMVSLPMLHRIYSSFEVWEGDMRRQQYTFFMGDVPALHTQVPPAFIELVNINQRDDFFGIGLGREGNIGALNQLRNQNGTLMFGNLGQMLEGAEGFVSSHGRIKAPRNLP